MTAGRKKVFEYSEELGDKICRAIATSPYGLSTILRENPDLPKKTLIYEWLYDIPEFAEKYAQAKRQQADLMAEECINIADDACNDYMESLNDDGTEGWRYNGEHVNRSRLRIDTRKWLASQLLPKVYGNAKTEEKQDPSQSLIEKLLNGEITINTKEHDR